MQQRRKFKIRNTISGGIILEYNDLIKAIRNELKNFMSIKYEMNDKLGFAITVINFTYSVKPCVDIFFNNYKMMILRYALNELRISLGGMSLNGFHISLKNIKSIEIDNQTINIFLYDEL